MCVGLRFGIDSSGCNSKKKKLGGLLFDRDFRFGNLFESVAQFEFHLLLITEVSILEIFVKLFTIWLRFQI